MLIPRLITAAVLIAFALFIIFYLPLLYFYIISTVIVAWLAWEWAGIIAVKSVQLKICLLVCYVILYLASSMVPIVLMFCAASAWWLIVLVLIIFYPKAKSLWFDNKLIAMLIGLMTIIPAGVALNLLHSSFQSGSVILLYALALVWIADSAAYFSGRAFGKHKLAVAISPKKTLEGLAGGMLFSLVYAAICGYYFQFSLQGGLIFVLLSLIAALFSVVGDLFISMLKRCAGLKDSGKLLPGHGGIFDRLDGICAAMPVFTLGLIMMSVWQI